VDLGGGSVDAISSEHVYPIPGIYPISVTVDYAGLFTQTGMVDLVTVFDPEGATVKGKGSIESPASAYAPDATVKGKIDFDFDLKYKEVKGKKKPKHDKDEAKLWQLEGKFKLHFREAGLELDVKEHDWMVISGAHARFQGEAVSKGKKKPKHDKGKDKDQKRYRFRVTVLDAGISKAFVTKDSFRIKIWEEDEAGAITVVYDNGMGISDTDGDSGTTPLSHGKIEIKKPKKKK